MIDFDYTAPELLSFRIQQVRESPDEPRREGNKTMINCPNCGAQLKSSTCEYCGSVFNQDESKLIAEINKIRIKFDIQETGKRINELKTELLLSDINRRIHGESNHNS